MAASEFWRDLSVQFQAIPDPAGELRADWQYTVGSSLGEWRFAGAPTESGAHSSRIERIPLMSAATGPVVVFAGRPTTEWASNAWARWIEAFLLIEVAIQNNGGFAGVIQECTSPH